MILYTVYVHHFKIVKCQAAMENAALRNLSALQAHAVLVMIILAIIYNINNNISIYRYVYINTV